MKTIGLMLLVALALAGCASASAPPPQPAPTEPARVLNFYNWDTYIDPSILADFEQRHGVTIHYETYESNEDLLAALEAGATDYDLIVPTDYMVSVLRSKGMLAVLNKDNLPNLKNLDPDFASPAYDPGGRYCVPYQWGTMGIGYDARAVGRELDSWADIFDPEFAGRVSMLSDPRFSLGVALIYLGYSPNSTSSTEIAQARDLLVAHATQIAEYAPDTGQDLLREDQVDMAYEWSGDIFQLIAENPDFRYVIPKEGSIIWTDSICIPITAPHPELAESFINYLLEPAVGAALSNYIHFGSPNQAAEPLLNTADRNNPALYPPSDVQRRLFYLVDVGPQTTELYDQAWQQVLGAQNGQGQK